MEPIGIEFVDLRLSIDHQRGASIVSLQHRRPDGRWLGVIARDVPGEDPRAKPPSFFMAPWTNRVRDAAFTFRGRAHRLRVSSADGTAIHGDVRSRPWRILDRSPVSARLSFDSRDHADINYPFPFACEARFELSRAQAGVAQGGGLLRIDLSVTNTGDGPMPAGCGIHPYFPRRLSGVDEAVLIEAPTAGRYPVERSLPTGQAVADAHTAHFASLRPIPEQEINDVFGGYGGHARAVWPVSGVEMRMRSSPNLGHLVLFAPRTASGGPEPFFAIEPLTMTNDGINLFDKGWKDTGVVVLGPSESLSTWYEIETRDL